MKYSIPIALFLLVATVVSCKKDKHTENPAPSVKPLLGTWELVADRGINGYRTYVSGEGFHLKFKDDYTYIKTLRGAVEKSGPFTLSFGTEKVTPPFNLIHFGDSSISNYHFTGDTLVCYPYNGNPGIEVEYAIWETKFVRTIAD
jgi:hypothetical protein